MTTARELFETTKDIEDRLAVWQFVLEKVSLLLGPDKLIPLGNQVINVHAVSTVRADVESKQMELKQELELCWAKEIKEEKIPVLESLDEKKPKGKKGKQ